MKTTRPTPATPDDDIGGMVVVGYGCVSLLSALAGLLLAVALRLGVCG
jgi:hypothetical protein